MGVQAVVLGASGYSGAEVLRYLVGHPAIDVAGVAGGATVGRRAGDVLPHLAHALTKDIVSLEEALAGDVDIFFSCLPGDHDVTFPAGVRVVDLSDRHRGDEAWTYGLTEFCRDAVRETTTVANPGCYPTAALLCLVPLVSAGAIEGPIVIDALSGTSGAGRKAEERLLHASQEGSASAYGTVTHRHVPEMERGLLALAGADVTVSFTPHLVPMARGVLVTARGLLRTSATDDDVHDILATAYADEPFVSVISEWPATKSVAGTNLAVVAARVDERAGMVVCSAAIDNLGKGAAGQAVQNANLMLGLGETTGLEHAAVWP